MKLRYLLILGILVFLNGFVFTVLLLMVSRELAEPAPTPTAVVSTVPTLQPTFTATLVGPTPTFTAEPTATNTPVPTPTNTFVVSPPTATNTVAPVAPTATSAPATATATGGAATATTPPTATPTTPAPTATATTASSYEFKYTGGMESAPNCDAVYFEGMITGIGGEPVDGRTVRLRFADQKVYRISGADGKPSGEWGFAPLAAENFHSPFTFLIDIVESEENPVPNSDTVEISFTDCDVAGQFTNIVFAYNW